MLRAVFGLILALFCAIPVWAADEAVYEIVPPPEQIDGKTLSYEQLKEGDLSKVIFVSATRFYDVVGVFKKFSGEIVLNPKDPTQTRIHVKVDPGSIETGNLTRDEHLMGEHFFDVKNYPPADFQSIEVKQMGPETYTMKGRLGLKGNRRVTEWNVKQVRTYKDNSGKDHVVFSADTTIDRKEFGVFWNAGKDYNPLNETKKEGWISQLQDKAGAMADEKFIATDIVAIKVWLDAIRKN